MLRLYLRLVYRVARPLRTVPPALLSLVAVAAAAAVPATCLAGGRWPLLAAAFALLSGLLDNLDGAVAVLAGRVSELGGVIDSTADRLADTAYAVALWLLGAPPWLAGLVAGVPALQEYLRARAAGAGMRDIGTVTVNERPTRVLMTAGLCLGAGIFVGAAGIVATAGSAAALAIGLVALGQVAVAVRRALIRVT